MVPKVNRIIIIVVLVLLCFGSLSSMYSNLKDTFFPEEKTYSLEAVKLMIKHDRIIQRDKELEIEYNIIVKDNERLKKNIPADSVFIANASRAYRDSIRAATFR